MRVVVRGRINQDIEWFFLEDANCPRLQIAIFTDGPSEICARTSEAVEEKFGCPIRRGTAATFTGIFHYRTKGQPGGQGIELKSAQDFK
jgi:hypothetical protein